MATSVALSTHPVLQTAVSGTSAQEKKFLDHCVEELDPTVASAFENQSTVWKTAAVATIVAFTVLSVSAFIATGVFAPVYIPVAGICALLLLNPVHQFYERFQQYAAEASTRANQLKEINHHYEDLTNATPENLQLLLFRMGIIWFEIPGMLQHPHDLATLKPLIARHRFWEGHIQKLEQRKQTFLQDAQKLTTENFPENREQIYENRAAALELEKQVLEAKIKDAFSLAVIRRPTLTSRLSTIGDFSQLSNQERVVGNAIGDASVNNLFIFKNNAFAALTADEVKRSTAAALSQRILAAAPAA